jgi:hypothetical protein
MDDLFVFYMEMIEKGCFLGKQNDLDHLLEAFEMNGRLTPDQCQHLYLVARKYPIPDKAAASPSREPGSAS